MFSAARVLRAGHSKWANIKHKKKANDSKRQRQWSKLSAAVTSMARLSGGELSPALQLAIARAKAANMPKANIESAIKTATQSTVGDEAREITYEGTLGAAMIMIECLSSSRNKSIAEVRHALTKHGGQIGTVKFNFERRGVVVLPATHADQVMEFAMSNEAILDVLEESDEVIVHCEPAEVHQLAEALQRDANVEPRTLDLVWHPLQTVELVDDDEVDKFGKVLDLLDDVDDVQKVHHNVV